MLDVAALGELLIDFTCLSSDADGYPMMAAHPGGAPANFLAALAKYGARCAMLGKVGDDTFGRLLLSTLRRAGIETRGESANLPLPGSPARTPASRFRRSIFLSSTRRGSFISARCR